MNRIPIPPELLDGARRGSMHVARLALAILCALSSTYCLLCYIPFTNQNFIQGRMIAWLPLFVAVQPLLFTLLAAAVVATTLPRFGFGRSQFWSGATAAGLGGFALWMIVARPLSTAGMDDTTYSRAAWLFVPLALVGLCDMPDASRRLIWNNSPTGESGHQFRIAILTAIAMTIVFFTVAVARAPRGIVGGGEALAIGITGFWTQLFVAACAFLALSLIRSVASFFYRSAFAEAVLILAIGALVASRALIAIVFVPLSLEGTQARILGLVVSISLALLVYGTAIRHRAMSGDAHVESGFDVVATGIGVVPGLARRTLLVILASALVVTGAAAASLASFDWDYLQQKLLVLFAWLVFAAILYRLLPRREPAPDATVVWLGFCVLILAGHYALDRWASRIPSLAGGGSFESAEARWRSWDVAFRMSRDATTLKALVPADDLYAFLRSHTNISRAKRIEPVETKLVERFTPTTGPRPHVFIFVIDSMRRDYVGAINKNVTFTPTIDSLARDGVSFRNAFTRYGATGLAEPSIWVGGMMLHKQYVEPFHPMNSLQKLLEWERYREFLGPDAILEAIVRDGPLVARLPAVGLGDDLCAELELLEARIEPLAGGTEPVFAYLQPLNLHISSIRREGGKVPPGEAYPGFDAPFASRVRKVDRCLGGFFDFLRAKGMWDSSIVVVTADHGDALAEGGQWGHAYSIAPEILRVPLVIKLPKAQRDAYRADPDAIAFITDITPTLYYLLGHRPIENSELLGRPLFTEDLREQKPYIRGDYLVASSYGPVYGILGENGRRLYISDAINFRDSVYEIGRDDNGSARDPDPGESRRAHALLREKIQAIADEYRFVP